MSTIEFLHLSEAGVKSHSFVDGLIIETFTKRIPDMNTREGITIDVNGPDQSGKTAIVDSLHDFLKEKGFKHVTVSDQNGELRDVGDGSSMLALLKETRPEIFETPVAIYETASASAAIVPEEEEPDEIEEEVDLVVLVD